MHGLLAVEFFVDKQGRLLFNEMAPRPHNSGHLTIECHATSQFEQYVRAACNLPPGHATPLFAGTMTNLIDPTPESLPGLMQLPGASVHLYGKEIRRGRKIGHVTIRGRGL